jgi:hypothetical protein
VRDDNLSGVSFRKYKFQLDVFSSLIERDPHAIQYFA